MDAKQNKVIAEHENFNAEEYLLPRVLGKHCTAFNEEYAKGFATLLHEVFSTHKLGDRLVDVGSGPMIRNVLSASAKYSRITLSDPMPQNRRMLQKYVDDVAEDGRWNEHYKFTAGLEGDSENWQNVRDRARASIRSVIWCDVMQDEPLGASERGNGGDGELYDCVLAVLCLSVACQDAATFSQAMKNLVSLAKPGAPIVLIEFIGVEFYEVDGKRYPCLAFTEELVRRTVEDAGCSVKTFKTRTMSLPFGDEERRRPYFIVEARKQ